MKPKLRCRTSQLSKLAERYEYQSEEIDLFELREGIVNRGCIIKSELRTIARWKAPRSAGYMEKNDPRFVKEISRIAFLAKEERTRIESLTLLDGVQWPTASVILHFFHKDPYPIVDFRALWSISMDVPNKYTFSFWWEYVAYCRSLAIKSGLDMRKLDQALWRYSKEKQSPE